MTSPVSIRFPLLLVLLAGSAVQMALSNARHVDAADNTALRRQVDPCALGRVPSGLQSHLQDLVSESDPDAASTRLFWKLPRTSRDSVVRVTSDSVCTLALTRYNGHLSPESPNISSGFIFRIGSLMVVEPVDAGGKHFKLVVVLDETGGHVASIAI